MPAVPGTFKQGEEAKRKISEAALKQWQNPQLRRRRSEAMKAAWAKRKEMMGICTHCGQPLPEESGR